ncbi:histone-lysine N-methyltransferase SETMAR-like [Hyposmocoma kahamanoa]|uniref:histone-lysine N-methyltransferase SETMAR-like n=1 Tax=Hyposmocoma kahamanoa TaxID=1477025 RepID=UPI000E6D86FE|nr:histone-lysine N-methyltransferase SETMAR-like [Hyposmocoma kahamanoa]
MTEQEVHPSVAQRIVIKFLANERVKPSEIFTRLRAQFGDTTLSQNRVYTWAREFRDGRERVENESHRRRPRSSLTDENISAVRELIEGDRRLTVQEISSEIGISYGSVQSAITDHLGFRKISARWVPRLLTGNQKQVRSVIAGRLLHRFQEEGEDFLRRIVTCDETWVHHYTPKSKMASKEWRRKDEGCPVKAKTRLSAEKVLATIFFDSRRVLLIDFLHDQRTVNATYYCQVLQSAKTSYRNKRRGVPIRDVILLHDNARPHTALLTRDKLEELGWETLEHPPYSPDLSPCDYFLFAPLKESLGGKRFKSNDDVEKHVRDWLTTRPQSFYEEGIFKLPNRWQKCVDNAGDYIEKC